MQARFLLGPAGTGKTFRCLTEARQHLLQSQLGPPLLFVAPKQTTYQIERRILADPEIEGYTRLHVLSFERLAGFVFDLLKQPRLEMLGEEGRLMALRALLAKHRGKLKVFRASARLAGFSAQLSSVLEEFQRHQLTPAILKELAVKIKDVEGLGWKIQDLATMLGLYTQWLVDHGLKDADRLLAMASEELKRVPPHLDLFDETSRIRVGELWVDGFGEFSPQELELLSALVPFCSRITVTFCLDRVPREKSSWLSAWAVVEQTFFHCRKRFEEIPGIDVSVEVLKRHAMSRFEANSILQHLERHWDDPVAFEGLPVVRGGVRPSSAAATFATSGTSEKSTLCLPAELAAAEDGRTRESLSLAQRLRIIACKNAEGEAVVAAREILRHVRAGGRYREVAVLVRKLNEYHAPLSRTLARYGIPFFLDRRESVAHHPAVELTRSALRTVTLGWQNEDLFTVLKTGLVQVKDQWIDRLENEAMARGWQGLVWRHPLPPNTEPELTRWLEPLLQRIIPPFHRLELALASVGNKPNGPQLSQALRLFWGELQLEQQLTEWSAIGLTGRTFNTSTAVHSTVWQAMNSLLDNIVLAFRDETIAIREWLAILEAAFANFSVGILPPALDQVLIGTVDRSRDPDIKVALVLGLNENVFPALPETGAVLTDTDRAELERHNVLSSAAIRSQLSRERYYAYLACTRPRQRLVLTFASQNSEGRALNPSPFLAHVQKLFPKAVTERDDTETGVNDPEHVCELVSSLLKAGAIRDNDPRRNWDSIASLPGFSDIVREVSELGVSEGTSLSPDLAERLYRPLLKTSVSRIEQFAACPFKFFVHSGLRAQERKQFELDTREQGSFQHDALALFHSELQREGLRWRELTPLQARTRIGQIAKSLMLTYRDGLFQTSDRSRFMGDLLTVSLQDFVQTLVEWMREQYQFDPVAVELPFGEETGLPAYEIEVEGGRRLAFKGRVDRIDLWPAPGRDEALCVVVDYKSSYKQLDPVLLEHGLQLQLLTYLNVLRLLPDTKQFFRAGRLVPAGVFYVSLRGKYPRKETRDEALNSAADDRKRAYQHTGRFDFQALAGLDARPNASSGDQFVYRLTADRLPWKNSREIMASKDFVALLDSAEANLKRMGSEIFAGRADVSPFRKGFLTACAHCEYQAICRVDPWTQQYRVLKRREDLP
jgi:ATP-dependent helicase/nuclease subunit B